MLWFMVDINVSEKLAALPFRTEGTLYWNAQGLCYRVHSDLISLSHSV
jgi:hypothetical protein